MKLRAEIAEHNKNPPVVGGFKRYRLAPPIPWEVLMSKRVLNDGTVVWSGTGAR